MSIEKTPFSASTPQPDMYSDIQDIVKVGAGPMPTLHRPDGKFMSKHELDTIRQNQSLIRDNVPGDMPTQILSNIALINQEGEEPNQQQQQMEAETEELSKTHERVVWLDDKRAESAVRKEEAERQQWFEEYREAQEKDLQKKLSTKGAEDLLRQQKDLLDSLGMPSGSTVNAVRAAGIMEQDWMVLGVEGQKEDDYIIKLVRPPADLKAGRPSIYTLPLSLLEYWQTKEGTVKYQPKSTPGEHPGYMGPVSPGREMVVYKSSQNNHELNDISFMRRLRIGIAEARKRRADNQAQKIEHSQKVIEEVTNAIMKGGLPEDNLRPKLAREKRAAQRTSQLKRKSLLANIHRRELEEGFGSGRGTRTPFIPRVDGNPDQRHVDKEPDRVAGRYSDLGLAQQKDRLNDGTYTKSEQRQERKAAKKHKKAVHHQEKALKEVKHQREGEDIRGKLLDKRLKWTKKRAKKLDEKVKRLKRA